MTAVADAWDECAVCGHDRDDHTAEGFCLAIATHGGLHGACNCDRFTEEEDG